MKLKIGVKTDNVELWQKIRLALRSTHDVVRISGDGQRHGCVMTFFDESNGESGKAKNEIAVYSEIDGAQCFLPQPFALEELYALLENCQTQGQPTVKLYEKERLCYVDDRKIKLTDVEYRLLKTLLSSDGFVSRDVLLRDVWGNEAEEGVLNVYVHYLREKLEKDGKKIILSSRKEGYAVSENYRREIC